MSVSTLFFYCELFTVEEQLCVMFLAHQSYRGHTQSPPGGMDFFPLSLLLLLLLILCPALKVYTILACAAAFKLPNLT